MKPNTIILHSQADDVVPFADSQELLRNSGLLDSAPVVVGNERRLADEEPLKKMLEVVERVARVCYRYSGGDREKDAGFGGRP